MAVAVPAFRGAPRPGTLPRIADEEVEMVIVRTLDQWGRDALVNHVDGHRNLDVPDGRLANLADVRIKPHLVKTRNFTTQIIGKVRDVGGPCFDPPFTALGL